MTTGSLCNLISILIKKTSDTETDVHGKDDIKIDTEKMAAQSREMVRGARAQTQA